MSPFRAPSTRMLVAHQRNLRHKPLPLAQLEDLEDQAQDYDLAQALGRNLEIHVEEQPL
jgi:hypothetical protein